MADTKIDMSKFWINHPVKLPDGTTISVASTPLERVLKELSPEFRMNRFRAAGEDNQEHLANLSLALQEAASNLGTGKSVIVDGFNLYRVNSLNF